MTEKILADRYRLTEQIGMGGMAIVYRAIDLRTGHNVAVKVLRPEFNEDSEFISRFQREAEAASKMTHHNIVNLLDVGMDGENRYLVMEYVQGKTLKAVIIDDILQCIIDTESPRHDVFTLISNLFNQRLHRDINEFDTQAFPYDFLICMT